MKEEKKYSIEKSVLNELKDYETKSITIVNGFEFNQKETIDKIVRMYNGRYQDGDVDVEGDKKYFFNICKSPCRVMTKAIDFDTSHIKFYTAAGGIPLKTWFIEREFNQWMKKNNFAGILNRIFYELPIFGSVVIKLVNGEPMFVDLRNFCLEASADTLDNSNFIIERHLYTPNEFKKISSKMNWENVEHVLQEHTSSKKPYICVIERYGDVLNEEKNEWEYKCSYLADVGVDDKDRLKGTNISPLVSLGSKDIKKHPYFEFHLEKIPGRWLGLGVIEVLFDNQLRENELANQQAKGTYWASLRAFQCNDESVNRNLATEDVNGEIIFVDGEIRPIDTSERNLSYFQEETQKWLNNRDETTFAYDVIRGERLPSGTTATQAKLATSASLSYFDQIRENLGIEIKKFIYKDIIPSFEKSISSKHILRIVGQDLDILNELLINQKTWEDFIIKANKTGKIPSPDEIEIMKSINKDLIGSGKERLMEFSSGFYDDAMYDIDIDITGESKDIGSQAQVLLTGLQAITADPTLLQDPNKKQILMMWFERGGINPNDLNFSKTQTESISQVMATQNKMGGGGVSSPTPQIGNIPNKTTI
jgi:hypothetical protein